MKHIVHDAEEQREGGGVDGVQQWLFPKTRVRVEMTDGERQEVPTGLWKR